MSNIDSRTARTRNIDSKHLSVGFDYCLFAVQQRVLQHIPPNSGQNIAVILTDASTPNSTAGHWVKRCVAIRRLGRRLSVVGVRREKVRFPVGARPTRQSLQPEAIGAVMEVTKWLKPSISVSRIGDSASVQAATRVNAEQSSKWTMRRPTRQPFRGRLIRQDEIERSDRATSLPP